MYHMRALSESNVYRIEYQLSDIRCDVLIMPNYAVTEQLMDLFIHFENELRLR